MLRIGLRDFKCVLGWRVNTCNAAGGVEVGDVRVEVKDLEDAEGWPSTDTVWVITGASVGEVKAVIAVKEKRNGMRNDPGAFGFGD